MQYIYTVPQKKKRYIPYFHLYVLKLEDGKYYVGISRNVKKRFEAHKAGEGAEWTKLHKPIKIVCDIQLAFCSYTKVKPYEDGKTIELMKKYGRENVRGGIYCAVDQSVVDSFLGEELCKEIDSASEVANRRKEKAGKKKEKKKRDVDVPLNVKLKGFAMNTYDIRKRRSPKVPKQRVKRSISVPSDSGFIRITIEIDYNKKQIYICNLDMERYEKQIKAYFNNCSSE